MDEEDDEIMNEIENSTKDMEDQIMNDKEDDIANEIENEHSAQARLQKSLAPLTPADRMKAIRQKAKDKAADKLREIETNKQIKKAAEKPKSKKQKRKDSKKKKKQTKNKMPQKHSKRPKQRL